ncbi:MAG: XRE family transcriptional regulator [Proteobacteria bacterium]|nr:XRE family transcriptional regulator [Pseudomonadota bacterium]
MAEQSQSNIAKNLHDIRTFRGFSMSKLAQYSGVSKAMISKIERGDGGASAETLGRLAEALDVGISDLMASAEPKEIFLQKRAEQVMLEDKANGFVRRALSPVFPNRGIDVVHNELQPGGRTGVFLPHKRGVHEYIVVLKGTLTAEIENKRIVVEEGDCLFFDAHVEHQLINESRAPVIWVLVIDGSKYARSIF